MAKLLNIYICKRQQKLQRLKVKMRIVPLDKEGKYLLQNFLEMLPTYRTTRGLFTAINIVAKTSPYQKLKNSKFCSNKIKRLFLDIYKRIYLKISKLNDPKNPKTISLSQQTQQKIVVILKHYDALASHQIFYKIIYRYIGDKQKGNVSDTQLIQFYQEVNKKIHQDGGFKNQLIDYNMKNGNTNKQELMMMGNGDQAEKGIRRKEREMNDKNWDYQIQKEEKRLQERDKKAKIQSTKEQVNSKIQPKIQQTKRSKRSKVQYNDQISQDEQDKLTKSQVKEEADRVTKKPVKKQQKTEIKTLKNQTGARKIMKIKRPEDLIPMQIRSDQDIWKLQVEKRLCEMFLKQDMNLAALAKEFSSRQKINPTISVQQLLERLTKLMMTAFTTYIQMCKSKFQTMIKVQELQELPQKYIMQYLKNSKAQNIRKKLIQLFLNKDHELSIKQVKEGVMDIIKNQDQKLLGKDQLMSLLAQGQLQIGDMQDGKRKAHMEKDKEEIITWKSGVQGRKLTK